MPVCLVTAPTVAEFADPREIMSESVRKAARNPQLGILSLAAVLEAFGESVRILDLNHVYLNYFDSHSTFYGPEFAEFAARIVAADNADVYGFSSICSSYPLTIRIAKVVKALRPEATILLGGPQASVVDLQTLSAFPFIDLILRGEAEQSMPLLLYQLRRNCRLEKVAGLSYRVDAMPQRNPDAPLINNLDSIPSPAYHLSQYLQGSSRASLELGRGCPFSCTFCSTNDFFRRKFRLRSPERVLQDMRSIAATYAIRNFELVHDMFTVNRRQVVAFCDAVIASGEGFTWSCSARTDCVDEPLLELMAKAGCNGIFYGVEVGSQRMQKVIDKHLHTGRAHEIIDATERLGIGSTVSLISGFPEETWDDVRRSIDFFMHSARCPKSHPQLNLLAPLAETPLLTKHKDELVLEELCSGVSHQAHHQDRVDVQMIVAYPDIFPNFYVIPTRFLQRDRLFELREFTLMGLARFRWMLVAIHQSTSGILDFFTTWRAHRLRIRPALGPSDLRQYYRMDDFRTDFADFIRTHIACKTTAVKALLDCEDALGCCAAADTRTIPAGDLLPPGANLGLNDKPVRRDRIWVFELTYDIQRIVDALKLQKKPVQSQERCFYVTRPRSLASARIEQISKSMAYLLRLCDGTRSVNAIVRQLSARLPEIPKCYRKYVCMRLLQGAENEQFIVVYRTTRVAAHRKAATKLNARRTA